MEFLGLLAVLFLLYVLIAPLVALVRSGRLRQEIEALQQVQTQQQARVQALEAEVRQLRAARAVNTVVPGSETSTAAMEPVPPAAPAVTETLRSTVRIPPPTPPPPAAPPVAGEGFRFDPGDLLPPPAPAAKPASSPVAVVRAALRVDWTGEPVEPTAAAAARGFELTPATGAPVAPESARRSPPAPVHDWTASTDFDAPPAGPSVFARLFDAAREWLFGGNLVARLGLLILFIGVAFLLRLASSYYTPPIEMRLAGVAAGALALLVWGFRIRRSRPGIGLSVQGAALAGLMMVSFAAFRYEVLPASVAFSVLLVLVAFTCVLAMLQDALWLAIFGIVGGFAVPILLSTGQGSHTALFSYYALLNAGVLAIALKRDWRVLNVLGFLFTFAIGTAWGLRSYQPVHYTSTQGFLLLFFVFYVVIAIIWGWRRAPRLKSTVDGTLVFGVPTVAMGLQAAIVRPFEYGMAFSALALGLFYALTATVLWRLKRDSLKLLVESFFALAVVFGTLTIPLACDDRWTSAAWALEGAAIVWVGLKQRQALVWRFGVLVQIASWFMFLKAWYGLDPLSLVHQPPGFGMLLLGAGGVFLAWLFQRERMANDERPAFGRLAALFLTVAVLWLLGGLWIEVWRRAGELHRVTLLVVSALGLVLALQRFGGSLQWRLPAALANAVTVAAGTAFVLLVGGAVWGDALMPRMAADSTIGALARSGFFGALLLTAGALVSALAFHGRGDATAARRWYGLAIAWWCVFALRALAVWLSWLTRRSASPEAEWPWYVIGPEALYAVGLGLSALAWSTLARLRALPFAGWLTQVFRPLLSALGAAWLLVQVGTGLPFERRLDSHWLAEASGLPFGPELLSSGWLGGLLFVMLALLGLRRSLSEPPGPVAVFPDRLLWVFGLGLCLILLVIDPLALSLGRRLQEAALPLTYSDLQAIGCALLVPAALWLARHWSYDNLRWLAAPAAAQLVLLGLLLLGQLYGQQQLTGAGTVLALAALWLACDLLQRDFAGRGEALGPVSLRVLHFGRVIAPALLLVPSVALWLEPRLGLPPATPGNGSWPWYLGFWAGIGAWLLLHRQALRDAWPLRPLGNWHAHVVLPLAAAIALLTVLGWNFDHDGRMPPLPYLPLLNPLDVSTGFVALLLATLWRTHPEELRERPATLQLVQRSAFALAFLWFNLVLLRSAAVWLELPYRFDALYGSQVVQALLSITWTLSALALMRYAVGKPSRALWMVGAALLGVVVVKLFLIDLRNIGSVARIVSFMGVGGLMLLIGYLAPLPAAVAADAADPERSAG